MEETLKSHYSVVHQSEEHSAHGVWSQLSIYNVTGISDSLSSDESVSGTPP